MPSTKDATLELIQREINEVTQREKELRANYNRSQSFETTNINGATNGVKPTLDRTKSTPYYSNVDLSKNANRLFTQNVSTKGVMHRFLKSRGKVSILSNPPSQNETITPTWTSLEITKPAKIVAGTQPRNGFVPVEEKIRREFHDMQQRETELRVEREKSQPDLLAVLNSNSPEPERKALRSTMSVLQLNDYEMYDSTPSQNGMKGAKSLSALCDIDQEEEVPLGSIHLIKQWENLIKMNKTQN